MKTWQAALAHIITANLQAASAVAFFSPNSLGGVLANTQVQLAAQTGLIALQSWIAKKNSNTDPNGNKLVSVGSDSFKTEPKY